MLSFVIFLSVWAVLATVWSLWCYCCWQHAEREANNHAKLAGLRLTVLEDRRSYIADIEQKLRDMEAERNTARSQYRSVEAALDSWKSRLSWDLGVILTDLGKARKQTVVE